MLADSSQNSSSGVLTNGITKDASIKAVVEFISKYFAQFSERVKGETTTSERVLTDKLCKFLNRHASSFPFYFHHENVENTEKGNNPQVDIGTVSRSELLQVEDRAYGEFDSFFSIEAKRLPTPGAKREKEYVIGTDKASGGIERFKKGIHGENLKYAAMIGYIQSEDAPHWFVQVNDWISDLIATVPSEWNDNDKLIELLTDKKGTILSTYTSRNSRVTSSGGIITIFHFWVTLTI